MDNDVIQVSTEYDMEEVYIGYTGDMYLVQDRNNNEDYYFKPAISKKGAEQPHIEHIYKKQVI